MTTVLTFRQSDGTPTECVMDDRNQWTLVFGDDAILASLKAITTIRQITPMAGCFPLRVQIQMEWKASGFGGEFEPDYGSDKPSAGDENRIH
jgi:hypothetical protein